MRWIYFPPFFFAAGGNPSRVLPGVDLLDDNARYNIKALYGVMHATLNMTIGDSNKTFDVFSASKESGK
jgi:hypothetical protein